MELQRCLMCVFDSLKVMLVSGCSCFPPSLASLSAFLFPFIPQWAGIHCSVTVEVDAKLPKDSLSCLVRFSAGVDWSDCKADSESDRNTTLL